MLHLVKQFNFILACDSYKLDHVYEMPDDITHALSLIVPRKKSKFSDLIVAMGQTFISHILTTVRIEQWMVEEAEVEANQQGYEFNRAGWETIVNELDGILPLAMYGVEEGMKVDPQTPIVGLVNTDPRFAWLPSDVETWTHSVAWKMSTVATTCHASRVILKEFMVLTGADMSMLNYKLHNFGDRGADSPEEAAVLAGISHAALFDGSDCTRANGYIKALYGDKRGFTSSVEATEHSVTCMNSNTETLDDFGMATMVVKKRLPAVIARAKWGIGLPIISTVIDTFDARRYVRDYMGGTYRDEIMQSGGKVVMRPDSGDPTVEPGLVGRDLEDTFGVVGLTSTGHKDLHPSVGILQGDGMDVFTLRPICQAFVDTGLSMNNILFGMGGGTTHEGGRDTFGFSMKTTAISRDGGKTWTRLLKAPKTDMSKKSLSGLVRPQFDKNGHLHVVDLTDSPAEFFESSPAWRLYSKDGARVWKTLFAEVQVRARLGV